MRHASPPDPHFTTICPENRFGDPPETLAIDTLVHIRRAEHERLRARLLELIRNNEQSRRNRHRWLA